MTHDLLTDVVTELKGEVVKVTVTELRENTYFARITIVQDGQEVEIDSRPSDAIALAVRCEAQIFAADDVVEESSIEFQAGDDEQVSLVTASNLADLDPEEFRRFIETVTPEEFATSLEEELEDVDEADDDERRGRRRVASARALTAGDERDAVERGVQQHARVDAVRSHAEPADDDPEEGEDREAATRVRARLRRARPVTTIASRAPTARAARRRARGT